MCRDRQHDSIDLWILDAIDVGSSRTKESLSVLRTAGHDISFHLYNFDIRIINYIHREKKIIKKSIRYIT